MTATQDKGPSLSDASQEQLLAALAKQQGLPPNVKFETEIVTTQETVTPPALEKPTPDTQVVVEAPPLQEMPPAVPSGTGFGKVKTTPLKLRPSPAFVRVELAGEMQDVQFRPFPRMGSSFVRLLAVFTERGFTRNGIVEQFQHAQEGDRQLNPEQSQKLADFMEIFETEALQQIEAILACYPQLEPIAETVPAYRLMDRLNLLRPLFEIVADGMAGKIT